MANMLDYLIWRGDVPFSVSPWNEIDALIVSTISYLGFHGAHDHRGWSIEEMARVDSLQESDNPSFAVRRDIFYQMAEGERFQTCRIHHAMAITDPDIDMQFSALCVDLPDGTTCIAFRGTDNTIVGWREDFNMAYQTRVPSQEAAVLYLTRASELSDRPLRLVGHSKGGNLAVYAAASVPESIVKRIEGIWSFDGPGMNREMSLSQGFLRIKNKIISFVPQTSIIGMLMDYYEPYTVVKSTASGLSQHDPISWQIRGCHFETLESLDQTAEVTRETLHKWLQNSTPEQRADFVDTLFRLVDTTKATRMSDLTSEKWKSLLKMVGNRKEVNPEIRRVFNRLMAQAVTLGFGNMIDMVRGRKENTSEKKWTTMSPERRMEMLAAREAWENEPETAGCGDEKKGTEEDQSNP